MFRLQEGAVLNYRLPIIVAVALVAVGCGSGEKATTAEPLTSSSSPNQTSGAGGDIASSSVTERAATAVAFNDADVVFAQNMIPHHEQAIVMADLALDPVSGAGADVMALAERVKAAQGPEVEMMVEWLEMWSQPMPGDLGHDDHEMAGMDGMAGLMSAEDMAALADATSSVFDELWLERMIEHHYGAIAMAEQAKVDGSNAEVISLADGVISAQRDEIAEMTKLLAG